MHSARDSSGQPLLDTLKRELERYRKRPFLDALMAGCALVATVDGNISLSERSRVDRIFESFRELDIFDPHEAVNSFNDFADALAEDSDKGRAAALGAIDDQASDPEKALLLLRACVAVSLADGVMTTEERDALTDVCDALALPRTTLDTAVGSLNRLSRSARA